MSNANVVVLEQPAYRVHREVYIPPGDTKLVTQELAKFFAQAPYPMGAPKPPGSLTLRFGRQLSARVAMDVYQHGAFHSGTHYSADFALGYLEALGYFMTQQASISCLFKQLSALGYRLHTVMRGMRDRDKRYHSFNYSPPLNGKGYEHPYVALIEHSHEGAS